MEYLPVSRNSHIEYGEIDGWAVVAVWIDGKCVDLRVIGRIDTTTHPPPATLNQVGKATLQALLATTAVMALLMGYPEIAVLALTILQAISNP